MNEYYTFLGVFVAMCGTFSVNQMEPSRHNVTAFFCTPMNTVDEIYHDVHSLGGACILFVSTRSSRI